MKKTDTYKSGTWYPIETAKDGDNILVIFHGGTYETLKWDRDDWKNYPPTHWTPLPPPPETEK